VTTVTDAAYLIGLDLAKNCDLMKGECPGGVDLSWRSPS
jgi:hypothetical protein